MDIADAVNGFFELVSAFMVYLHIRVIKKDKEVKGMSIVPIVFFTVWGFWNIFFYPYNGLYLSAIAGAVLALVNSYYFYLIMKYK
jgi:hypothetical protein